MVVGISKFTDYFSEYIANFGVNDNLIVFARKKTVLLYILCTNVNCKYGDLSFKQKKAASKEAANTLWNLVDKN